MPPHFVPDELDVHVRFNLNFPDFPIIITAARTREPPEQVAPTASVFLIEALRTAPTATLDGILRSLPRFSLFSRSDSLTANPTAQGVSLRGLGSSGASRLLFLLDGVPLIDPFGGWVAWTKVPREGLARAELIAGGGATAWGNAALGGVGQLFTQDVRGEVMIVRAPPPPDSPPYTEGKLVAGTRATLRFDAAVGDFGTRSFEFAGVYPTKQGTLQLLGRDFSTDGFLLVASERRGPIDVAGWSRHRWLTARWRQPVGRKMDFIATARSYEEFRGDGTPYTRNGSREKFASLDLAGQPVDYFTWNAVVYAQDQSFASTSSLVNATRTAETPVNEQYALPATAFGSSWTGVWKHARGARTSAGFDWRSVRGETSENFAFSAGNFTRQRVAGGEQMFVGFFALHEQQLGPTLRATFGARLDRWRETDGHRRETDRNTGAMLRDDQYANHDGVDFNPSAGLVWTPSKAWRVRATAQRAFRVPTANELYRPFYQGNTVVESNPNLRAEHDTSAELGAEWTIFRKPLPPGQAKAPSSVAAPVVYILPPSQAKAPSSVAALIVETTLFWSNLHDAIGNVAVARGPGTFSQFGALPAGGVGRQRLNLDRIRAQGVELTATWRVSDMFSVNAAALLNDATVRRASVAPALVGDQVAEVPRHSATFGATWRAPGGVMLTPRVRWLGRQFTDVENTLRLGETVVADLGVSRVLTKHLELFLTIENLGNARVETDRSADGIVNIGTPQLALASVRGTW